MDDGMKEARIIDTEALRSTCMRLDEHIMLAFCIYTCFMPISVSSIDVNVLFDLIPLAHTALEGLAAVEHSR